MREVLVLGGYGYCGLLSVREIARTTRSEVVVGGRSIQRAEQIALACGERVRAAYVNAADGRTLRRLLPSAAAVVACCGGELATALDAALELRVPFIGVSALRRDASVLRTLAERAWQAQVPVILQAGAVPGLPGVLAERFVRRHARLHAIRIASTGPWEGSETARRDLAALRAVPSQAREFASRAWGTPRTRAVRFDFAEPVGARTLRVSRSLDLDGFPESHLVENLVYLEPDPGPLARGLGRLLGLASPPGFAIAAEAWVESETGPPCERIALEADDAPTAAAAVVGSLVRALLQGRIAAGLHTPREALHPESLLEAIQKSGVRVSAS